MARLVKIGSEAPNFTLRDQNKDEVRLSDYRGEKNVVLAFYPMDWSPVCEKENACFTHELAGFNDEETEVLAISTDSVYSHKAWAEKMGFEHKLLSDIKRDVCKLYGLHLEEMNVARRATVVVDKQGIVRHVHIQELKETRDISRLMQIIRELD